MAKKKSVKSKKSVKKSLLPTPEEQYKYMITRYGTNAKWVDAQVHLTQDEMLEYFGAACEEFDPYCGCCKSWLEWNSTGKATVMVERDKLAKLIIEGKL